MVVWGCVFGHSVVFDHNSIVLCQVSDVGSMNKSGTCYRPTSKNLMKCGGSHLSYIISVFEPHVLRDSED